MKPPLHASTFRALLAAAVLAGGLAASGGRDNDRLGAHDAPSFETQMARSQAAAVEAQRKADVAEQQAREARAGLDREAAAAIHDADITQAISARLARERSLREAPIKVQTLQGVVWLRGHVPSEAARSDAELLARTTDGVLAVRNRLDVVTR